MTGYIGINQLAQQIKGLYVGVGNVAKQAKKAYIGINGIAKLWYSSALEITYSGSYTDEIVTMDGSTYRLLTLTSSGTLSASAAVTGDIWICGGGCGGYALGSSYGEVGGAGAYAATANNQTFRNIVVTIGAGGQYGSYDYNAGMSRSPNGGATSITGDISLTAQSGNIHTGGSGGGGSYGSTSGGSGDGIAKTPFGSSYFPYPYCDGGGGGGYRLSSRRYKGGNGGTNGGNGGSATSGSYGYGTRGGQYGGYGAPAVYTSGDSACDAIGYGSGGGGGARDSYYEEYYNGGTGYQGVCFIRIPV